MAIHFQCSQCQRPLFADDKHAGLPVACPACKARNTVPPLATTPAEPLAGIDIESTFVPGKFQSPSRVTPLVEGDPHLLDMEKARAFAAPPEVQPAAPATETPVPEVVAFIPPAPAPAQPATPAVSVSAPVETTRRCPICAETIQAAAKKCRFCGAILDEAMREADEHERKTMVATGVLAMAERSANLWRAFAVLATGITVGWLLFLTLRAWDMEKPNLLMLFNPLLIIGLIWASRQMRRGPPQVFLAAALAIVLCMPLYLMLGPPLLDAQAQQKIIERNPEIFSKMPPSEQDAFWVQSKVFMLLFFLGLDFIFALPVWMAMLKVAAFKRLRETLGKAQ